MVALLIAGTGPILARAAETPPPPFQPGDKIEYRESSSSEVWEQGVFVAATPDGRQPIIRKKPNQFYKDGAQTAFDWANIRPVSARPVAKVPVETPVSPSAQAAPAQNLPAVKAMTGGLLTQEEILGFLKSRLGTEPFAHPRREEIVKELAQMIKARGVNFRYETLSDFSNQLGVFGASSVITFPL